MHGKPVMNKTKNISLLTQAPKNKDIFLFRCFAFCAATMLFIIPFNTIPVFKIFLPILTLILTYSTIYKNHKIYKSDIIVSFFLIIVSCFNFSFERLADSLAIIIILLFSSMKQMEIDLFFSRFIYVYSLIGIVCQLLIYRYEALPVLSILDPNYSGCLMLLFFYFCHKKRFYIGMLLSIICSFLFIGRGYLLSLMVFFIIGFFEIKFQNNFILKSINKIPFWFLIILMNIGIYFYGLNYINNFDKFVVSNNNSREDISRIFNAGKDYSNYNRFLSTTKNLEMMTEDGNFFLFGLPSDLLADRDSEDIHMIKKSFAGVALVHNSIVSLMVDKGILLCIIYLIILNKIMMRFNEIQNLKYKISYSFFSLFLHGLFSGFMLLFLTLCIMINIKK
jgi:hypothetical protein